MSVRVLITGGTFDKEYDEIKGELFFDKTHINELLKLGRCRLEVEISTLMLIDSLTMTSQDRLFIKNSCKEVDEKKIVNEDLSLASGSIKGWDKRNEFYFQIIKSLSEHFKFNIDVPFFSLSKKVQKTILYGPGNEEIKFIY